MQWFWFRCSRYSYVATILVAISCSGSCSSSSSCGICICCCISVVCIVAGRFTSRFSFDCKYPWISVITSCRWISTERMTESNIFMNVYSRKSPQFKRAFINEGPVILGCDRNDLTEVRWLYHSSKNDIWEKEKKKHNKIKKKILNYIQYTIVFIIISHIITPVSTPPSEFINQFHQNPRLSCLFNEAMT